MGLKKIKEYSNGRVERERENKEDEKIESNITVMWDTIYYTTQENTNESYRGMCMHIGDQAQAVYTS